MTTDSSPTTPRLLQRSSSDTKIAGVSGGLGRYFGVDPLLFRVGFAVTALAGGSGLLAYLALWIFMPRDDQAPAAATQPPAAA